MTMLMRKPPKLSLEASTRFKERLQIINNVNSEKFDKQMLKNNNKDKEKQLILQR